MHINKLVRNSHISIIVNGVNNKKSRSSVIILSSLKSKHWHFRKHILTKIPFFINSKSKFNILR